MKIVITGAEGFLGRHLRTRLKADGTHEVAALGRDAFADKLTLMQATRGADAVVHLAGINRGDAERVEAGNLRLAEHLVDALDDASCFSPVIFANSVQAGQDSPYGRGKQRAAHVLATWADTRDTTFRDIIYQNVFGEGGRPDYNSFVATFCRRLADGRAPEIHTDRAVELIHAQDAAQILIEQLGLLAKSGRVETHGVPTSVSDVAIRLQAIATTYSTGRMPDLSDAFTLQLFNTYRSYVYPGLYPYPLTIRADPRGRFVEAVQSSGGQAQTSFSTTRPGVTRGNHFHLRKVERFLVLRGTGSDHRPPGVGRPRRRLRRVGRLPVLRRHADAAYPQHHQRRHRRSLHPVLDQRNLQPGRLRHLHGAG